MTAPATGWRKPPPCTAVRNASETEPGHDGPRPAEFGTLTAPECLYAPTTMGMPRAARPVGGRWPAVLAWALWLLVPLGWAATAWLDGLLRRAGLAEEARRGGGQPPGAGAPRAAGGCWAWGYRSAWPASAPATAATGWWPGRVRCRPPPTWPESR